MRFALPVLFLLGLAAPALAQEACAPGTRLFENPILAAPVCVPEAPERVAFIDDNVVFGLELGVESVTRNYYSDVIVADFPGIAGRLEPARTVHVGRPWEMNGELLLSARPDLVISSAYLEEANAYARGIAPTLVVAETRSWLDTPRMLAELFGKQAEQKALEDGVTARVDAFRKALEASSAGRTFSFTQVEDATSLWTFTTEAFGPEFAVSAGMALGRNIPTPEVAATLPDASSMAIPVSQENLDFIDADSIFLYANLGSDPQAMLRDNVLFQRFAKERPGRIHFISGEYWFRGSAMSAHRVIDDLYRAVLGVEPETVSPNPFAWAYARGE